jgi:hypothetical protein
MYQNFELAQMYQLARHYCYHAATSQKIQLTYYLDINQIYIYLHTLY